MLGIPDKYFWPGLVIALLGSSMIMWGTMLYLVQTDDRPQVVGDFYQKAVDYDEIEATRVAARETGWKVRFEVSKDHASSVVLDVADRDGKPVGGLNGTVAMYRPDLGDAIGKAALKPLDGHPGRYAVAVHPTRSGLWDFTLHIERDGHDLFFKVREDLSL